YTVEKSLREFGDRLSESERREMQDAIERCKNVKDTSNEISEIKSAIENLTRASHKLAEHIYRGAGAQAGAGSAKTDTKGPEEEVVEAEFEDVDKDKGEK
ncbi:MAG: molecular chaperone DnaK, partial [Nitrospirota bacterium]